MSEGRVHEWRGLKFEENGNEWNGVEALPSGMYRFAWNGVVAYGGTAEEARALCDELCADKALLLLEGLSAVDADPVVARAIAAAKTLEAKRWERRVVELERRLQITRDAADGRI